MSSARIESDGKVVVLDGAAEPDEVITEADVQDPAKLARYLSRSLKLIAELQRKHTPRRIDFENLSLGVSGAAIQLQHNFGGAVRWWVVDNVIIGPDTYILQRDEIRTTDDTLVILSYSTGRATIRVEEAG